MKMNINIPILSSSWSENDDGSAEAFLQQRDASLDPTSSLKFTILAKHQCTNIQIYTAISDIKST